MIARLGQVVYWASTALAVLVFIGAGWVGLQNAQSQNLTPALILVVLFSVCIWLFGRAALYILAGR